MSFYEGSAMQQRDELQRQLDNRRLDILRKENPSLQSSDLKELLNRERIQNAPKPRCCPCTTGRAEWIRTNQGLIQCTCSVCHSPTRTYLDK